MNNTIHDADLVVNIAEEGPAEISQHKPPVPKPEPIQNKTGDAAVALIHADSPLTIEELQMVFGRPLLQGGIDYSAYVGKYLTSVHHILPKDVVEKESLALPSIGELARHGEQIALQVTIELLIAHDSQMHRQHNCRSFEKWVNLQGLKMNHSTIDRALNHARVLLIFAANGGLDTLPNQAQANALVRLPRSHWLSFFRQALAWTSAGKAALERMLPAYAHAHHITLEDALEPTPTALPSLEPTAPPAESEIQTETGPNQGVPPKEEDTLRLYNEAVKARALFLEQLAQQLKDYIPVYRHQSLVKKRRNVAKHYLGSISKHLRNKRNPARVEQRVALYGWLLEHETELAEEIHKVALANFFDAVDKSL